MCAVRITSFCHDRRARILARQCRGRPSPPLPSTSRLPSASMPARPAPVWSRLHRLPTEKSNTQFASEILQGFQDDVRGSMFITLAGACSFMTRFTPNSYQDYVPLLLPWSTAGVLTAGTKTDLLFAGLCDNQPVQQLACVGVAAEGANFNGSRSRRDSVLRHQDAYGKFRGEEEGRWADRQWADGVRTSPYLPIFLNSSSTLSVSFPKSNSTAHQRCSQSPAVPRLLRCIQQ